MAPSRALLAAVAMLATSALACDALIGLDAYSDVDGSSESGQVDGDDTVDSPVDMTNPEVSPPPDGPEGSIGSDAGDAADGDASIYDGPVYDGLPLTAFWARWPMPNPDAAIAPGADAMLPNPMSYAGGGDAGPTVVDNVTHLTWRTMAAAATSSDEASMACQQLGTGWRVPTRIELVSLIDFTQQPTIDNATFPGTMQAAFWTASIVPVDASPPEYWVVDFGSGFTKQGAATYVRCVQGGP
jgi:hypothetical protein